MNCEKIFKIELNCTNLQNLNKLQTNLKILKLWSFKELKKTEENNEKKHSKITFLQVENSIIENGEFLRNFPNLVNFIFKKNYLKKAKSKLVLFKNVELKILQNLDLSENQIENLEFLKNLTSKNLLSLDISNTKIQKISNENVGHLKNLKILKIIKCKLKIIEINKLKNLVEIYLNKTIFNEFNLMNIHKNLKNLKKFYSISFELCCILKKYSNNQILCQPNISLLKSCSKIIKNQFLSIFFWIFGLFGFFINFISIFFIYLYLKSSTKFYRIFLSISDFTTSAYILSVSIINVYFGEEYIEKDLLWRRSTPCKLLGITFIFSIYSSFGTVVFMTIERFLSIKYPFKTNCLKKHQRIIVFFCFLNSLLLSIFQINFFTVSFQKFTPQI